MNKKSKSKTASGKKSAGKEKASVKPKPKTKKTASKKKPAKSKTATKKPAAKKKSAVAAKKKQSGEKTLKQAAVKKEEPLFMLNLAEKAKEKAGSKSSTSIPVIDLEKLTVEKEKSVAVIKEPEKHLVATGSRVSFYLGVFFGAIVVNVFVLTLLAVFSL